jgi:hypothetical protein
MWAANVANLFGIKIEFCEPMTHVHKPCRVSLDIGQLAMGMWYRVDQVFISKISYVWLDISQLQCTRRMLIADDTLCCSVTLAKLKGYQCKPKLSTT